MQETVAVTGMVDSLWSDIVASRYELCLFAVSVLGYLALQAARSSKQVPKELNYKVEFSYEASQVLSAEPEEDLHEIEETATPEVATYDVSDPQSAVEELLVSRQYEKACDIFEMNYATFFDWDIDQDMEKRLLMAALQCGRHSLADHLLQTSQTDFSKNVLSIQRWWRKSSANSSESRMAQMRDVLDRMAQMFNEQHPFEDLEHSDDESTCALGEELISEPGSLSDDWDDSELWG